VFTVLVCQRCMLYHKRMPAGLANCAHDLLRVSCSGCEQRTPAMEGLRFANKPMGVCRTRQGMHVHVQLWTLISEMRWTDPELRRWHAPCCRTRASARLRLSTMAHV